MSAGERVLTGIAAVLLPLWWTFLALVPTLVLVWLVLTVVRAL